MRHTGLHACVAAPHSALPAKTQPAARPAGHAGGTWTSPWTCVQEDSDDAIVFAVATRVEAVALELLRQAQRAQLLLLGLLPRGEFRRDSRELSFAQPCR